MPPKRRPSREPSLKPGDAPKAKAKAQAAGSGVEAARALRIEAVSPAERVKQELDGVAWAATLGFPRAYLARGAEIAETEQRAITLKQLKELAGHVEEVSSGKFLRDHKGKEVDWNSVNLYVINDCIVVPFTLRFRCSFVELVAEGPQLPRWFVSHWWGTPFCQTVSLLAFHGEQRQLAEASPYWICTFANNQHDLSSLSGTLRQTPFVRAILSDDCVGTLALLDSNVTTFDRIWCVLENFVSTVWAREAGDYLYDIAAWLPVGSALHGGRPVPAKPTLRLDFGRSQAREVVDDEATGGAFPLQVAARGACVNIRLAKASREEDKRKILHLIAGTAEEDWAQPPPEECEAFDSMNARVRRMFAAGALYRAALQNDSAELKRLLVEFPDAKDEGISDGASPVYAAAMKDHTEVLEALLDARANADTTKDDGASAAFIATQFGSPKALNLLLGASADPNRARQEDGVAPVYMAVQSSHSEELKMLLEARANPNQLTAKGASPLHLAAQLGKPEPVSLLLELEADPNLASTQGQTALSLASNKKVISILQEAGAKIEVAQPQAEPSSSSAASPKKPAAKGKAKAKPFATTFASAQAEPKPSA